MGKKTYDNPRELLRERKQLVSDVVRNHKPKRIPICSQTRAWPILDAGFKLTEALSNYDLLYDILCKFHERYEFDLYADFLTRFSYNVTEIMGGGGFVIDDERQSISYPDIATMRADEYQDLVNDGLLRFYFERVFERKYSFQNTEDAITKISAAVKEQLVQDAFNKKVLQHFENNYGIGRNTNASPFNIRTPVDTLLPALRGIKGFSVDLRRIDPELFKAALNVIDDGHIDKAIKGMSTYQEKDTDLFAVVSTSKTSPFLSRTQFEKYDWPYWKKFCDAVVKYDLTALLFPEGQMMHFVEFFQELPAGHFAMIVEMEDLGEMRKKLPNFSFCGGFPSFYLGHKSKQECLDKAKQIIDDYAYDGRLIFSTDKMLAYADDAKGENLEAVNNFVREYGVYK